MIERLTQALDALAATPLIDPARPHIAHLLDDCADAARLELDCPQEVLTDEQASALRLLCGRLEYPTRSRAEVAAVVDEVRSAFRR